MSQTTRAAAPDRIRFGGEERDGHFHYELSGGQLVLDLANTLDERGRVPIERLAGFGDVVEWARQAGLVTPDAARGFDALAEQAPDAATAALREVIAFREAAFRLFVALAQGAPAPAEAVADLNRWALEAARHAPLVATGQGLGWHPVEARGGLLQILWPIVRSAVALAIDPSAVGRLRCCHGEGCEWLFLDMSRRQNRRWCDMSVCGNRAKVRTFRKNERDATPAGRAPVRQRS